jgi:hypothetical protein
VLHDASTVPIDGLTLDEGPNKESPLTTMNEFHGGPQCGAKVEATSVETAESCGGEIGKTISQARSSRPETSLGEAAIRDRWPEFTAKVERRLQVGCATYGDKSFQRPVGELIGEIEQELFDVMGWGFILYCRLEEARKKVAMVEEKPGAGPGALPGIAGPGAGPGAETP